MNSESGQRLSMEELKQRNLPQAPSVPATHPDTPTKQDWDDLLAAVSALYRLESTNGDRLNRLEASVGAQETRLWALSREGRHHDVPARRPQAPAKGAGRRKLPLGTRETTRRNTNGSRPCELV